MTVRDLKKRLGPLAWPMAETAGYSREYFDHAGSKGVGLPADRRAALVLAIRGHIVSMERLIADLDDNEPGATTAMEGGHQDSI